jgi:transcriptional regulator with XRE-family HTH domain
MRFERQTVWDRQIGRNFRFHRTRKGLSQTALGAQIGICYQQVQKYETAANRVPASRLAQIARLLDLPIEALLGDQAEPINPKAGDGVRRLLKHRRRLERAAAAIADERLLSLPSS